MFKRVKRKVMKENNNIKNEWLHLRLSKEEYDQINLAFSKTTEKKLSRYARAILLGKPLIAGYRDLSADDLIKEFPLLIKTLNGIANNYNQSIHKLHTMDHHPQIKSWLDGNKNYGETLLHNIEEIKDCLKKISSKWLQ
jgi:predicted transglutaminase-like cysteine proteinase